MTMREMRHSVQAGVQPRPCPSAWGGDAGVKRGDQREKREKEGRGGQRGDAVGQGRLDTCSSVTLIDHTTNRISGAHLRELGVEAAVESEARGVGDLRQSSNGDAPASNASVRSRTPRRPV